MSSKSKALTILESARESFQQIVVLANKVDQATAMIVNCLKNNGRVFFCGNGGSAADAHHLALSFLVGFK